MKKIYSIKLIDEYGECYYHITQLMTLTTRKEFVDKFKGGAPSVKYEVGDVTVIKKSNGEELWIYEETSPTILSKG